LLAARTACACCGMKLDRRYSNRYLKLKINDWTGMAVAPTIVVQKYRRQV
jgi:hypothetical protein